MAEGSRVVTLYLLPGMKARLKIPAAEGGGFFVPTATTYNDGVNDHPLIRGFYEASRTTVGLLTISDESSVSVDYLHQKPEPNSIWFIPDDDIESRILYSVVAAPIHDHSSIVQGGPAYGTYFSDDNVEE